MKRKTYNRITGNVCEGCGRWSKGPVLACARCKASLPRTLLVDVGLASNTSQPGAAYWTKTAAAVRDSLKIHWTRIHHTRTKPRRDLRPLRRRRDIA